MGSVLAIAQWIHIGIQVLASGQQALTDVKGALSKNGIDADTSELDRIIADAEKRKAMAESEAAATE